MWFIISVQKGVFLRALGELVEKGENDLLTGFRRMKDWANKLLRKWSWASRILSKSLVAFICCRSCENWDSSTSTWWICEDTSLMIWGTGSASDQPDVLSKKLTFLIATLTLEAEDPLLSGWWMGNYIQEQYIKWDTQHFWCLSNI